MSEQLADVQTVLRQQSAIASFGTFALRERDLLTILTTAARVCSEGLGVPFCKVCRYRERENDLLIEAGFGWHPGVIGHVVSRADESSPQGRAFITGKPAICNDLRSDHTFELPAFYAEHGIISTIDVIIKGNGKPYGVLEIDNNKQHNYNEHDIEFLTAFANVLAEAVATSVRTAELQATIAQMKVMAEEKDCLLSTNKALTEELQEFAHVASHDLKAPLRAISLLADWITDDLRPIASTESLEHLALMRQRVTRLQMLIEGLLTYTRIGHAEAPLGPVDVGDLVAEIAGLLGPPPGFHVRFDGKAPVLNTQRPPLEHVLQNLISNALRHHDRPTGEIVVSTRTIDGIVEFSVRDDGPGIAPALHERIFRIFATSTGQDQSDTAGVGLSIVQKTVQRFGGKVWIISAPPARGTTFVFTWPDDNGIKAALGSGMKLAAE